MAIDSRVKRTSAANLPFMLLFPEPDGSIELTDRMMMVGSAAILAWVSPDSHDVSSEANWDDCAQAYDDNPATYAVEKDNSSTEWLILEWSTPLRIDAYRFLGNDDDRENGGEDAAFTVFLYEGGVWRWEDINVATKDVWYEVKGIGALGTRISKARIKSTNANAYYLNVAGFQLRSLGQFYPAAARTLANGGLYANPLIKGGLVR